MFHLAHNFYTFVKERSKTTKNLKIVILGLDNAGKTTLSYGLKNELPGTVAPTWGFNKEETQEGKYELTFYDLGGGEKIRKIWTRYFPEVHGIIFVIDANDKDRLEEAKKTLFATLEAASVPGKPILIFANKQDLPGAMTGPSISAHLNLQATSAKHHILPCTALTKEGSPIDPNLKKGLSWLTNAIESDFAKLSARVNEEYAAQVEKEKVEREEQRQRAAASKAARLKEQEEREKAEAARSAIADAAAGTGDPATSNDDDRGPTVAVEAGGAGSTVVHLIDGPENKKEQPAEVSEVVGSPIKGKGRPGYLGAEEEGVVINGSGINALSPNTPGLELEGLSTPVKSSEQSPTQQLSNRDQYSVRLPPLMTPEPESGEGEKRRKSGDDLMQLPNMIPSPARLDGMAPIALG